MWLLRVLCMVWLCCHIAANEAEYRTTHNSWKNLALKPDEFESIVPFNMSLVTPGYEVARILCKSIESESYEGCLFRAMQSHRTFRLEELNDIYNGKLADIDDYSRILALSYGIESVNSTEPIDVCFFGAVSKQLILFTLMSSTAYNIKIANGYLPNDIQYFLYYMRHKFPGRQIQWIPGDVRSWIQPPAYAKCNIIYIDEPTAHTLPARGTSVFPTPFQMPYDTGRGASGTQETAVIILSAGVSNISGMEEVIRESFSNIGVGVDWRLHTLTANMASLEHDIDYEGFAYRMMWENESDGLSHIRVGVMSVENSSTGVHMDVVGNDDSQSYHPCSPLRIVVTYNNRFFHETAVGLKQALIRIGFGDEEVAVWGDMHYALAPEYSFRCTPVLQIAIAPHEEAMLLQHYVVLHLEQSWSRFMNSSRYHLILVNARAVWTFSHQHDSLIASLGVDPAHIFKIPLYLDRHYMEESTALHMENRVEPNNITLKDLAIFGSYSSRRYDFLKELQHQFRDYDGIIQISGTLSGVSNSFMGRRRDRLVRNSKIVLNVHGQNTSALEVHRLNYLLSMGACVISEPSVDKELDREYDQAVVLAALDDFANVAIQLLRDRETRYKIKRHAVHFARNILDNVDPLKTALTYSLYRMSDTLL